MGKLIRKDAAAEDIAADANATLKNANAKGGAWKQIAGERLGPVIALYNKVDADWRVTRELRQVLDAELEALDSDADDFLGAKADEMWNMLGRPANDTAYALIWPGGYSTYADGSDEEQPHRMNLLAELLGSGLHPQLDPKWTQTTVDEVKARAAGYTLKLEPTLAARAKEKLLAKMRGVLSRAMQMELSRLKRRYLAEGFTEAAIHQVIPDRPRKTAAKPDEAPGETPNTPEGAGAQAGEAPEPPK
jgi:hypothetical protein